MSKSRNIALMRCVNSLSITIDIQLHLDKKVCGHFCKSKFQRNMRQANSKHIRRGTQMPILMTKFEGI